MKKAEPIMRSAVDRLESLDLAEDDIRRLMENELALRRTQADEEASCVSCHVPDSVNRWSSRTPFACFGTQEGARTT